MAPLIDPNGALASPIDSEVKELPFKPSPSGPGGPGTRGIKRPAGFNDPIPPKVDTFIEQPKLDGPRETRCFPCTPHMRSPGFPRLKEALPFPDDLSQLIAWTDAFVEHLGWQALQQHQKSAQHDTERDRLKKERDDEAQRAREAVKDLGPLKDENTEFRRKIAELTAEKESFRMQLTTATGQIKSLSATVADTTSTNLQLKRSLETSENNYKQLEREFDDLQDLYKSKLSDDEFERFKESTRIWKEEDAKKDAERETVIEGLRKDLQENISTIQAKDTEIQDKVSELAKVRAESAGLGITNKDLDARLKEALNKWHEATEDLDHARSDAAAQLGLAKSLQYTKENLEAQIRTQLEQLHNAQLREEKAIQDVKAAKDHSRDHWNTLQKIRVDGGWSRTKSDQCERPA